MKKIAIFPGDFNPIHSGHLLAIEECIKRYNLDEVHILPFRYFTLPYLSGSMVGVRENIIRKVLGPKMRLLICEQEKKDWAIKDIFNWAKKRFKDDDLYILMGTSLANRYALWGYLNYIVDNFKFILYPVEYAPLNAKSPLKKKGNSYFVGCKRLFVTSQEIRRKARRADSLIGHVPTEVEQDVRRGYAHFHEGSQYP